MTFRAYERQTSAATAGVSAEIEAELRRSIRLKSLPNGDLRLRLSADFGWRVNPLAQLADFLTEDKHRSLILHNSNGERENFVVSTPRLRVRFFPDARDENSVIVLSVEASSPDRWRADKRSALPCRFTWTADHSYSEAERDALLESVRGFSAGHADKESFWEFWSEYIGKEKEQAKSKREHPGWGYSQRRWGLEGCVDFNVGDSQSEILTNSSGRLLVPTNRTDDRGRAAFLRFEIRKPIAEQWIAAAPLQRYQLDQIPKSGLIKIDWISIESERKRREDALHRLRLGQTALPALNAILPSGENAEGERVEFSQLLDKPYNEEQVRSISKALSDGTITAILGPPGTGKTSVIAEIASQFASMGRRVLISSQSNLAVDNALERVLDSDQIFRIRIGRPESVRFNQELLKERASDRFRRMLLDKSKRTFEAVQAELASTSVRSSGDVDALCSRVATYVNVCKRYQQTLNGLAGLKLARENAKAQLGSAKTALDSALRQASLNAADLEGYLQAIAALGKASIVPESVFSRHGQITNAPSKRLQLQNAKNALKAENEAEQRCRKADKQIEELTQRIEQSAQKQKELERLRLHNQTIAYKRQTVGFWKKLGSYLTDIVHDLEPLEREIRNLAASAAKASLPSAQQEKRNADDVAARCRVAREEASTGFGVVGGALELELKVNEIEGDLAVADILIPCGGLQFASKMQTASAIERLWHELQLATDTDRTAEQELKKLKVMLDEIGERKSELGIVIAELDASCSSLGVLVPERLETANGDVFLNIAETYRNTSDKLRSRQEKWPQIALAVSAYHARLSEEAIDMSKAAIAEANVVGATCSGIAGSGDFAEDFDCVIIDEAGRATPLDLLMPMVRGRTIVLVGDHKQLPPLLNQEIEAELLNDPDIESVNGEYRLTLFERLFKGLPTSRKESLRKQYRMVDTICDVVREISYREKESAIETAGDALQRMHPFKDLAPIHWIKCDGERNVAEQVGYGIRNWAEVEAIREFIAGLVPFIHSDEFGEFLRERKNSNPYEIGVIAMYRQQALALEAALAKTKIATDRASIEVGTVDAFQGREKDAVIVSFVETNPNKLRFFYDRKRLNVALSRARELLVLVGGLDVLGRRATVRAAGVPVRNPLNELQFLFEACLAANHASREVYRG